MKPMARGLGTLATLFSMGAAATPQGDAARELLARAAHAVGDPAAIRAAGGLTLGTTGIQDRGAEGQGRLPGSSDPGEYAETIVVGPELQRVAFEVRLQRNDTTSEHIRELYAEPRERFIIGLDDPFVVRLLADEHVEARQRILNRVPTLLIAELARDPSPTLLPDGAIRAHAGGRAMVLTVDPETALPRSVAYEIDLPSFGDSRVEWRFAEWFHVDRLGRFPRSVEAWVGAARFLDLRITSARPGADPERLAAPEGDDAIPTVEPPADASSRARVEMLAEGVHRVVGLRNGFHPLFVELRDSIVVVDAPAGYPLLSELPAGDVSPGPAADWLSVRLIELIRATVPDKPIGHVVLTHFHNDHAGGVRAFIAAGAAVWVGAGEAEAVRAYAAAPHRLMPDSLARAPRPERIHAVDGRARIGDATRTIEILDTGANPHSEHNLVVQIPDVGILFVSDLFQPVPLQEYPNPRYAELDAFFARWLRDQDLAFDRIYAMHATGVGGADHIEAALRIGDR